LYFKFTKIFLKLQLFDKNKESPANLQVYISYVYIYPKIEGYLEHQYLQNQFIKYKVFQDN